MSTKSSFEYGSIKSRLVFQESLIIFCPQKFIAQEIRIALSTINNKRHLEVKQEVWKSYYRVVEVKNVLFAPRKSSFAFLLQN